MIKAMYMEFSLWMVVSFFFFGYVTNWSPPLALYLSWGGIETKYRFLLVSPSSLPATFLKLPTEICFSFWSFTFIFTNFWHISLLNIKLGNNIFNVPYRSFKIEVPYSLPPIILTIITNSLRFIMSMGIANNNHMTMNWWELIM